MCRVRVGFRQERRPGFTFDQISSEPKFGTAATVSGLGGRSLFERDGAAIRIFGGVGRVTAPTGESGGTAIVDRAAAVAVLNEIYGCQMCDVCARGVGECVDAIERKLPPAAALLCFPSAPGGSCGGRVSGGFPNHNINQSSFKESAKVSGHYPGVCPPLQNPSNPPCRAERLRIPAAPVRSFWRKHRHFTKLRPAASGCWQPDLCESASTG